MPLQQQALIRVSWHLWELAWVPLLCCHSQQAWVMLLLLALVMLLLLLAWAMLLLLLAEVMLLLLLA
jgi:hypothetical protein